MNDLDDPNDLSTAASVGSDTVSQDLQESVRQKMKKQQELRPARRGWRTLPLHGVRGDPLRLVGIFYLWGTKETVPNSQNVLGFRVFLKPFGLVVRLVRMDTKKAESI